MLIAGHQVDEAMFAYIATHADADTFKLLLKAEPGLSFDKSFAVLQIECRQRAKNKIPELLRHEKFLFPKAISAEQCTHETVARFHASLFDLNDRMLDMTMGLGVDDYYISQRVKNVTAVELDKEIAEVGEYNFAFLAPNVEVVHADSVEYLKELGDKRFDAIFIDPARRGEGGKRLYGLADCQPDVLSLLPLIRQHCSRLFIKASPMLDVTQSMRELGDHLADVWAVSVKNECKELLFKLDFEDVPSTVTLHAMNYTGNEWLRFESDSCCQNPKGEPCPCLENAIYLYEPNASIMKLGCYGAVEQVFGAQQLAPNSHLMVSDRLIDDFPGRQFKIIEVIPFKDKEIRSLSKRYPQLNVATRNFRISAEALKKRLRVKDGGDTYLFATTLSGNEQVLILSKKKCF